MLPELQKSGGDATNYPPSLPTHSIASRTLVAAAGDVIRTVESDNQVTSTSSPKEKIAEPAATTHGAMSPEHQIAERTAATNNAVTQWLEARCTSPDSVWGGSDTTVTEVVSSPHVCFRITPI